MSYDVNEETLKAIFDEEIWPDLIINNPTPQAAPCAYVLGGQPGAGKSQLESRVEEKHNRNFVSINGDEFRRFHPEFDAIEKQHGLDSTNYTAAFSGKITEMALEKAREEKLNILVEGTFRTAETPIKTLSYFHEAGYRNTVMVATCPKDVSWSSTLERYNLMQEAGEPARFTPRGTHDLVVSKLAENIEQVAESGLVEAFSVHNRRGFIGDSEQHVLSDLVNTELSRELTEQERKDWQQIKDYSEFSAREIEAC